MGKYRSGREAKPCRRPWEFSKKLAAWAVLIGGAGQYTNTTTSDKEAKG